MCKVAKVTKKWKHANESCAPLRDGSEKMRLFVKTYTSSVSVHVRKFIALCLQCQSLRIY